jgi:hypothetical protein
MVPRPAPITRIRSAPRWIAGLIGASWRIEPSPKYSRWMRTAGNRNGMALEAIRWSRPMTEGTPIRWVRRHGATSGAAWKNDRLSPDV